MAFLGGRGASSRVRSLSNTKSCREKHGEEAVGQKRHRGRAPADGGAGGALTDLANRSLIALGGAAEEGRQPGGGRRDRKISTARCVPSPHVRESSGQAPVPQEAPHPAC